MVTYRLKRKAFGLAGISGITNLGKAFGSAGKGLSTSQKVWEGTKGVAKMGAIGTAAVGTGAAVVGTGKALTGNVGNDNF